MGVQDEKQTTFAITADMTRQYKSMQEELMRRIHTLEQTIMEQKDQLDLARQANEELVKHKDQELALKDAQVCVCVCVCVRAFVVRACEHKAGLGYAGESRKGSAERAHPRLCIPTKSQCANYVVKSRVTRRDARANRMWTILVFRLRICGRRWTTCRTSLEKCLRRRWTK